MKSAQGSSCLIGLQVELKVYKQKVRHLLYEHKIEVQQLKEAAEKALAEPWHP